MPVDLSDFIEAVEQNESLPYFEKMLKKFNVNEIREDGVSALAVAAAIGRLDLIMALLKRNAAIVLPGAVSPVLEAVENGNFDIVKVLLDRAIGAERKEIIQELITWLQDKRKERAQEGITLPSTPLEEMNGDALIEEAKKYSFINIQQFKIISKFAQWLKLQQEKDPKKYRHLASYMQRFFSKEGYCNGLTWLFLYKTAQSILENDPTKIQAVWQDLTTISEWDGSSTSADAAFEGLFNEITLLQDPALILSGHTQENFVEGIGDYQVHPGFAFSEIMSEEELLQLKDYLPEGSMIKICSSNHVTGMIKMENGEMVMFDTNQPQGKMIAKNMDEFVNNVKKFLGADSPNIEVGISIYTLSKEPLKEADHEAKRAISLLEKLYEIRNKAFKANMATYQEALKKYEEESAKGIADLVEPLQPTQPINIHSTTGATPLNLAAQFGNLALVRWYLEHGADPNQPDHEGTTPLHYAATNDNPEIVKLLLEKGANYELPNEKNITPLETAIFHGNKAAVKTLMTHIEKLDKKRLTEAINRSGIEQFTPLMLLCEKLNKSFEVIDMLVQKGADINAVSVDDNISGAPLFWATISGNPDIIRKFLRYSAKNLAAFNAKVKKYLDAHPKDTALVDFPGSNEDKGLYYYPMEKSLILDGTSKRNDPLTIAVIENNYVIIEALLDAGATIDLPWREKPLLTVAIEKNDPKMAAIFISHGAKIPKEEVEKLITLVGKGNPGAKELAKLLIQKTNVSAEDLLTSAITHQSKEIIQLVLTDPLFKATINEAIFKLAKEKSEIKSSGEWVRGDERKKQVEKVTLAQEILEVIEKALDVQKQQPKVEVVVKAESPAIAKTPPQSKPPPPPILQVWRTLPPKDAYQFLYHQLKIEIDDLVKIAEAQPTHPDIGIINKTIANFNRLSKKATATELSKNLKEVIDKIQPKTKEVQAGIKAIQAIIGDEPAPAAPSVKPKSR